MLSNNKKEKNKIETPKGQNLISQGTKVVGDIISEGDFRIDGVLEGSIETPGKVVVGKDGFVSGKLMSSDAIFEGKFSGEIDLSGTLTLMSSAHIEGKVFIGKLAVEPGATFNVTCTMKGTIKDINKSGQQPQGQRVVESEKTA